MGVTSIKRIVYFLVYNYSSKLDKKYQIPPHPKLTPFYLLNWYIKLDGYSIIQERLETLFRTH